jgi:hypothetical protein
MTCGYFMESLVNTPSPPPPPSRMGMGTVGARPCSGSLASSMWRFVSSNCYQPPQSSPPSKHHLTSFPTSHPRSSFLALFGGCGRKGLPRSHHFIAQPANHTVSHSQPAGMVTSCSWLPSQGEDGGCGGGEDTGSPLSAKQHLRGVVSWQ